jgi:hypothetical protein
VVQLLLERRANINAKNGVRSRCGERARSPAPAPQRNPKRAPRTAARA